MINSIGSVKHVRETIHKVWALLLPNSTDKVHGQCDSLIKYLWIDDIQYYNRKEDRKSNIMFILIMT